MPRKTRAHIAILGAGPIGVEAAVFAQQRGFPVTVYERGKVGEHLRQWGHVRLFSPFSMNHSEWGLAALREAEPEVELPGEAECVTGHRLSESYLEPLARTVLGEDVLRERTEVLHLGRRGYLKSSSPGKAERAKQPFLIRLRDSEGRESTEEADILLDCTGTYGNHRWLGEGGIPALGEEVLQDRIAYGLEDILGKAKAKYAGKTTMVIGSGYSAATSVCRLATLAEEDNDTWTIWLTRAAASSPLKRIPNDVLKERDRIARQANTLATRPEGNVEHHARAAITAVEPSEEGFLVHGRIGEEERSWEVENLIANVGFEPDNQLYRELQVHECYASQGPMKLAAALLGQSGGDCLTLGSQGPDTLKNPEPNFYILGSKSYGRSSHFLLRTGFEQIREVLSLIEH